MYLRDTIFSPVTRVILRPHSRLNSSILSQTRGVTKTIRTLIYIISYVSEIYDDIRSKVEPYARMTYLIHTRLRNLYLIEHQVSTVYEIRTLFTPIEVSSSFEIFDLQLDSNAKTSCIFKRELKFSHRLDAFSPWRAKMAGESGLMYTDFEFHILFIVYRVSRWFIAATSFGPSLRAILFPRIE